MVTGKLAKAVTVRHKEGMRWFWRGLLAVVVLGVLLAVGGLVAASMWLDNYLQSEAFQARLTEAVRRELDLEGEFLPLHWSGQTVHTDGFAGKGMPGAALKQVRADQVRAELRLRALLEGVWKVPEITVQRLVIELGPPGGAPATAGPPSPLPAEGTAAAAGMAEPGAGDESGAAWLAAWLPRRVEVDQVTILDTDVTWQPAGAGAIRLAGMKVVLEPDGAAWNATTEGGRIQVPSWPAFEIPAARLRYAADMVYLTKAEVRPGGQGAVDLSGEISLRGSQPMRLTADVRGVPMATVAPGAWHSRITGNLEGRLDWKGDLANPVGLTVEGPLRLHEGRLEALPILAKVAQATKVDDFRSIRLDEARARVSWNPGQLRVSELVLRSDGLLRAEGAVAQTGETLDGKFQLGTVPRVLKFLPGAESQVFTEQREGYVWTDVRVFGTGDAPQEDLSPRLQAAAVGALQEQAAQTVESILDAAKSLLPAFLPGRSEDKPKP